MTKLLLVDFYALFHRSRNALMRATGGLSTSYGRPTTGTYGFTNNLLSVIDAERPSHVAVCYDAGGNWRKEADAEYKANRAKDDGPEADSFKAEALALMDEVLPALGLPLVGVRGYEADDSIYTLARNAIEFDEVVILTCDQDILQCVTDKVSVVLFNSAKKIARMGVAEVVEKWGVQPQQIPLIKALAGDSSDNIAGIKGLGPKTALRIVEAAGGSFDRVLEDKKVAPFADLVRDNMMLTTSTYVPELQDLDYSEFLLGSGTVQEAKRTFEAYEFSALGKRLKKIGEALKLKIQLAPPGEVPYAAALKQLEEQQQCQKQPSSKSRARKRTPSTSTQSKTSKTSKRSSTGSASSAATPRRSSSSSRGTSRSRSSKTEES
jgi:5'-3' exonuclease